MMGELPNDPELGFLGMGHANGAAFTDPARIVGHSDSIRAGSW
jgi:hypothetical protein